MSERVATGVASDLKPRRARAARNSPFRLEHGAQRPTRRQRIAQQPVATPSQGIARTWAGRADASFAWPAPETATATGVTAISGPAPGVGGGNAPKGDWAVEDEAIAAWMSPICVSRSASLALESWQARSAAAAKMTNGATTGDGARMRALVLLHGAGCERVTNVLLLVSSRGAASLLSTCRALQDARAEPSERSESRRSAQADLGVQKLGTAPSSPPPSVRSRRTRSPRRQSRG
jgi:hypothetical protein